MAACLGQSQIVAPAWSIQAARPLSFGISTGSIALGASGEVYIAGHADEFKWPQPTKTYGDTSKEYNLVSRLDSTGTPVYTIALGGTYQAGVSLDVSGNLFVMGSAVSSGFYTSPSAYRSSGFEHALFVAKLRASDGELLYSTYLDVEGGCLGPGIDSAGNASFVCGRVSNGTATAGSLNRGNQIYVGKLNADGSKLLYGATFGGSAVDYPDAAAFDAAGNAYIAGRTYSSDFPTTPNAVSRTFEPGVDELRFYSFVAKVNAAGTALLYSTLGKPDEQTLAIALDPAGAPQIMTGGSVRRYTVDASGISFEWNSRGLSYSLPKMTIDSLGVTTILGLTNRIDFPVYRSTQACRFTDFPANWDNGYLVRLSNSGTLLQSTYLQGSGPWFGGDLRVTPVSGAFASLVSIAAGQDLMTQSIEVLTFGPDTSGAGAPLACLGNAATFMGGALAPGEMISLFGEGLGPFSPEVAQPASGESYPTLLGATQVLVGGVPAPLLYVESGQINAVVPFGLAADADVYVLHTGVKTNPIRSGFRPAAPGIFTVGSSTWAAAVNQDGTVNAEQNPAAVGSIVSLFVTGLGAVVPGPADGSINQLPPAVQQSRIDVLIPPRDYHSPVADLGTVLYAGPAPFAVAGFSQINVMVPATGGRFTVRVTQPDGTKVDSIGVVIWTKPAAGGI